MVRYTLDLSVIGPIMATGVETRMHGIDAPFLRDSRGRFILPGTQIRGILSHILKAMAQTEPDGLDTKLVDHWFGVRSADADADKDSFQVNPNRWAPSPGILTFGDLVLEGSDDQTSDAPAPTLTRIAVDSDTGSVKAGALQVLERPLEIGQAGRFIGHVDIRDAEDNAGTIASWLSKALTLVPVIGAHKTVGFGQVAGTSLKVADAQPLTVGALDAADAKTCAMSGGAALTLTFHDPFLVSTDRWLGNSFRGAERISGRAMKAILAQAIGADAEDHPLHTTLGQVLIRELRPVRSGAPRPTTMPLSRYWIEDGGDGLLADVFADGPPEGWDASISFSSDWKPGSKPDRQRCAATGWTFEPTLHVRTRTAINAKGTAEDGKLFSTAAMEPGDHLWTGWLLPGGAETDDFAALLAALPTDLRGIGKTRATASISVRPWTPPSIDLPEGRVRLVLETDAVLHRPEDVARLEDSPHPSEALRLSYQDYFAAALSERAGHHSLKESGDLDLRFMARQRRVGGYLSGRYPPTDGGYTPWFVTEAGSVFEFSLPAGDVYRAALYSFFTLGLPPPPDFDARRRRWQGNPFVPENGFGELRLWTPPEGTSP